MPCSLVRGTLSGDIGAMLQFLLEDCSGKISNNTSIVANIEDLLNKLSAAHIAYFFFELNGGIPESKSAASEGSGQLLFHLLAKAAEALADNQFPIEVRLLLLFSFTSIHIMQIFIS
jgi:hypothetical protein